MPFTSKFNKDYYQILADTSVPAEQKIVAAMVLEIFEHSSVVKKVYSNDFWTTQSYFRSQRTLNYSIENDAKPCHGVTARVNIRYDDNKVTIQTTNNNKHPPGSYRDLEITDTVTRDDIQIFIEGAFE